MSASVRDELQAISTPHKSQFILKTHTSWVLKKAVSLITAYIQIISLLHPLQIKLTVCPFFTFRRFLFTSFIDWFSEPKLSLQKDITLFYKCSSKCTTMRDFPDWREAKQQGETITIMQPKFTSCLYMCSAACSLCWAQPCYSGMQPTDKQASVALHLHRGTL